MNTVGLGVSRGREELGSRKGDGQKVFRFVDVASAAKLR